MGIDSSSECYCEDENTTWYVLPEESKTKEKQGFSEDSGRFQSYRHPLSGVDNQETLQSIHLVERVRLTIYV